MRYIHLHYSLIQLHYNYNYHTTQITISQQKPYKIKPTFATIILRINTHKFQQQCTHLCAKSYCQLKLAYFQPVNSRFLQVGPHTYTHRTRGRSTDSPNNPHFPVVCSHTHYQDCPRSARLYRLRRRQNHHQ